MSSKRSVEARRRAQLNYNARMQEKGFRKFTIWLPEERLKKLKGNLSIQEFVENLVNQQVSKE